MSTRRRGCLSNIRLDVAGIIGIIGILLAIFFWFVPNFSSFMNTFFPANHSSHSSNSTQSSSGSAIIPTPQTTVLTHMASVDTHSSLSASLGSARWNHRIGAYSNRLLMVEVVTASPSITVTSATFSSIPLKLLVAQNCPTDCRVEVWYVLNPPPGAFSISVTTSSGSNLVTVGAISFYNVDQNFPSGTQIAKTANRGRSSSLSVPSETNQLVVDFYGNQATPDFKPTAGPGQTKQVNVGDPSAQEAAFSTKVGDSPGTTMTWRWENTNNYADIGLTIRSN